MFPQTHELLCGHVLSVGQAPDAGNWGAKVSAYPFLMSPFISPLPLQLFLHKASQGITTPSTTDSEASTSAGTTGLSAAFKSQDVVGLYTAMLQSAIAPHQWQYQVEEARARSGGACEVTGAPPGDAMQLDVVPIWQYNEQHLKIQVDSKECCIANLGFERCRLGFEF
jgi:hypothetical protein